MRLSKYKHSFFSFYLALPQGQGHHNSVSQLLWARSTYPTLSTFSVGGNRSTRRKPMTFGRALTLLFSREDWVRVHLTGDRTRNLGGGRRVVWPLHHPSPHSWRVLLAWAYNRVWCNFYTFRTRTKQLPHSFTVRSLALLIPFVVLHDLRIFVVLHIPNHYIEVITYIM